ncbi:MAG: phosphatase PAP2 family protein [Gammaproteobacteria bacterium]|nr:phosphatase PAP2 family protein [Gammaproteobacteria bacterium]
MLLLFAPQTLAAGGPFGIDQRVAYDDSGIWGEAHQNQVLGATMLFVAGAALWQGNDSRFGHTMWQSADAVMLAFAGHFVLANTFQRRRPHDTADPDEWFQGFGNTSFPSGHVMLTSAAITPIVFEYGRDYPWVWLLEAIPLYEAIGRVKVRAHWQSDVLVGWALGTALGWYAHSRKVPILIRVLPDGFAVGLQVRF